MKENSSERYEALPEAWLQNELFEQTKDYLTRGRRFEMLGIDQLNDEWAKAFRLFVSRKIGLRGRDLDDAGAELRLRGAEFPTKLVTSEIERLRAAIQHIGLISSSAEFNIKIDELTSDMGKLKH
ncbi:MAG: hypothetical protein ACREGB_02475 [Candidatus Saccharimonadales bacterium]